MSYSFCNCDFIMSKAHAANFISVIALACMSASCTVADQPVRDSEYPTALVGTWRGTVGDDKESMTLNADHTFVCRVRPLGFIATMVWPVHPETLNGNWTLNGKSVTLTIAGSDKLHLDTHRTSSTITAFTQRKLTLKNEQGETSVFSRDPAS